MGPGRSLRTSGDSASGDGDGDGDGEYSTSCVVFSRHLDVSLDPKGCKVRVSSDRRRDLERYRSIRHLLPAGFTNNSGRRRSSSASK